MTISLTALQCRVIGVLLEKEITTPDQYPLSLNALTNGCNQKSSREPVMTLSELEVQNTLDELMQANLVNDQGAFSGRVAKYQHRFCNTEFGDLQFNAGQRAIICLLLLRGPQTPGELRTRSNRLAEFSHVNDVENALMQLSDFNGDILVRRMAKQPGKREARFTHLFSPIEESEALLEDENKHSVATSDTIIQALTERVENLESQVASLHELIESLTSH